MSWVIGFNSEQKRHIGYGVLAICDHPECTVEIDRGLGYMCGEGFNHNASCHGYFCAEHRENYVYGDEIDDMQGEELEALGIDPESKEVYDAVENGDIVRCRHEPIQPNKESASWLEWVLSEDSWAKWREENPKKVAAYQDALKSKQGNVCVVVPVEDETMSGNSIGEKF